MSNFLFQPGELKKRVQKNNLITDLIFTGASEDMDDWTDIEVITLKQHARDQAIDKASSILTAAELDQLADKLYQEYLTDKKEFIKIEQDKILIGIDCEQVDDSAVDKALLMLIEVESFEPQTIYF